MLTSILYLHIAGGTAALLSMFVPLLTTKGGQTHRRAGMVFVCGMTVVSITALVLAGTRWTTDPTARGREAGAFLFFVSILTATSVSSGVRVLRAKSRTVGHRHPWDLGLPALLSVSSIAAAVYGLATGNHLFTAFSVIGLLTGGSNLSYWLMPPSHPMHWWFEHMSSMLGACIAATTAFLVVNAGNLGMQTFSLVMWLAPSVIGVPTIAIWTRYYRKKFAPAFTRSLTLPADRASSRGVLADTTPRPQ
jgi:hypothetical protein